MKIIPLNKYILVEPLVGSEKTKSGLAVGTSEGDRTESIAHRGKVLEITEAAKKDLKEVKVGDTVMIAKWEAQIANIGAKKYYVIKPEDILLLLKD